MNMARYEQETIINFNEEEKTAGIYTHNKALRQKLAACLLYTSDAADEAPHV